LLHYTTVHTVQSIFSIPKGLH